MLYNPWPVILSSARQELGISCEKAAEQADVSVATWYRWEKGVTYPGPQYLGYMANGLGIDPDVLGLRYCEVMTRHYSDRLAGDQPASAPEVPPEDPAGTGEASLTIRGMTSSTGEVWVKLNDVLEKVFEVAARPPERPRPRRRHRSAESVALRRRKRL